MQTLREHCIKAGVKVDELDKVLAFDSIVVKGALAQFESTELAELLKVWRLIEPECWAYYELTEAFYLAEWRLLERARKELRKGWRRIYSTFVAEAKNHNRRTTSDTVDGDVSDSEESTVSPDGCD